MTDTSQYAAIKTAKQAEAQIILDAYLAVIAAFDAADEELWFGGVPPIYSTQRGNLMFSAYKLAEQFELPWDGPTFPTMNAPQA